MTDKQILKKAIEKAIKNGWDAELFNGYQEFINCNRYYALIFNHDFAKAFWGDFEYGIKNQILFKVETASQMGCGIIWQYHLQQMVLKKEPLKYIEKFLGK